MDDARAMSGPIHTYYFTLTVTGGSGSPAIMEPDHARLHRLEGTDHESTVRCLTHLVLAHGHGMEGWEAPEWRAPWRSDTPTDPPE